MEKRFKAYIADNTTRVIHVTIIVKADGLLTAISEAHRLCKLNYSNCYVSNLEEIK